VSAVLRFMNSTDAHLVPISPAGYESPSALSINDVRYTTSDVRTVYCEARYTCVPVSTKAPVSS
jgi:hypothetical protein